MAGPRGPCKVETWRGSAGGAYLLPALSSASGSIAAPCSGFYVPLLSRVEDWRVSVGRGLCSLLARPFVCECHNISTMPRFQPPPRQTQRAELPHWAFLLTSHQALCDLSVGSAFEAGYVANLIISIQAQSVI